MTLPIPINRKVHDYQGRSPSNSVSGDFPEDLKTAKDFKSPEAADSSGENMDLDASMSVETAEDAKNEVVMDDSFGDLANGTSGVVLSERKVKSSTPKDAAPAKKTSSVPSLIPLKKPDTFLQSRGCIRCFKFFASREEKKSHFQTVHHEKHVPREEIPADLQFPSFTPSDKAKKFLGNCVCSKCGVYFSSPVQLNSHLEKRKHQFAPVSRYMG